MVSYTALRIQPRLLCLAPRIVRTLPFLLVVIVTCVETNWHNNGHTKTWLASPKRLSAPPKLGAVSRERSIIGEGGG